MSALPVVYSNLPEECLEYMQVYLGTREIAAGEGILRGIPCKIDCEGAGANSPLVIVGARPMENTPWNFGCCFAELPGESEQGDSERLFRMRYLTLRKSLWLFVWSRDGQPGQVRDCLLKTNWFKEWAAQRGLADTSEAGLDKLFDTLGFDELELPMNPPADSDDGNGSPATESSRCGLFFWGDIGQTSATLEVGQAVIEALPWLDDIKGFLGNFDFLFAKTKVEYKGGFPFLTLQWPPGGFNFGGDGLSFQDATINISSIPYFTPQDTSVGIEGDFVFSTDKKIHVDLVYPLEGDLIWASGKYTGGPEHFLGDSASFGLPGPAPTFRADEEIELVLEFSKMARTLTKISFSIDLHENWHLLSQPVPLSLEGLSCYVTIYQPLSPSRVVLAQLTAEAAFGDGRDGVEPVRLACGGSYPDGDLFLQARNSVPIGKLIEKLVGPSAGLEKLTIEDLRIGYNYRTGYFSLELDVQEKWPIFSGFEIADVRFQVEGEKSYKGSLAAVLKFAEGTADEVDVSLKAAYGDGWQFEGSTGPGQKLSMTGLIAGLDNLLGTGRGDVPAAINSLTFDDLSLVYNTGAAGRFAFKGNSSLEVDGSPVKISVHINVADKTKTFGGQVTIGDEQFTVLFDDQKVQAGSGQDQDYSTALIALYEHDSSQGAPAPNLRHMVGMLSSDLSQIVPAIEIHKAIFGYHKSRQEGKTTSAWLFGVELGDINFSIRDPSLPIVSALIGSDLKFGVESPQVLVTSHELKHEVLAQLPSLGDKFKLPEADLRSASFSADLTLGAEKYPLMLSLGESPEKQTTPEAGTEPASPGEAAPESPLAPAEPATEEKAITATPAGEVKWIKIQKQVSVLYFDKIGVRYKDGSLGLLLGASLTAAGLTISLEGFSISSPLDRFQPSFDLSGLGIRYRADPVEVSGSFLKEVQNGTVQYSGQALIKAESFMLSAIGSYTTVNGVPSMFIFAFLDAQLGGPPCFFVTGLAAGFGYNSSVRVPAINEVKNFPLLAAMVDPGKIGGKDAGPLVVLKSLRDWIKTEPGACWLAAGISFRSFGIINSNVLAIAEFGQQFQVQVLGFSTIRLPQKGSIYANVELMIQILIKPAEGVISAMAQLTSNSYLFDPDCHLTGGFAFCVWFGNNPNAGDFVLTIGGYHPAFKVPKHYPMVPRLGFNWQISSKVTIKGEAYFALTPACVMAGGALEVSYHSGNLRAWFIARADMIIYWNPFYFEAGISVRIGASYRVKIWFVRVTLSVELGAAVELWGPPTGGKAHISWSIISFTVSFGAKKRAGPRAVDWTGFKAMLPQRKPEDKLIPSLPAVDRAPTDPDLAVIQINVNNGLLQQVGGENSKKRWIIRPDEFIFSIETATPLSEARLVNPEGEAPVLFEACKDIGIRPMGIKTLTAKQTVTIQPAGKSKPLSFSGWNHGGHTRSMPKAMWGSPGGGKLEAESLVENCLIGVKDIRLKPCAAPSGPPKFMMENVFAYFPIDLQKDEKVHRDYLPLTKAAREPEQGSPVTNDALSRIQTKLTAVAEKRTAVFKVLAGLGKTDLTDGDLEVLAADPAASLKASPRLGSPVPESR